MNRQVTDLNKIFTVWNADVINCSLHFRKKNKELLWDLDLEKQFETRSCGVKIFNGIKTWNNERYVYYIIFFNSKEV